MSENNQPLVSVIMNCLNSEKYLKEAIDSVYAQTYSNWEIIFWDNASTDNSPAIAQSHDERLRYYRGEETICLGAARNKAMEKARGEFIAFLDCDDLWMPEKLELQIPLFADSEVGVVYSDAIYFNEKKSWRLYSTRPYYTGRVFLQMLSDYFICLQTVVIRRTALQGLQDWVDPRFYANEEMDLFCRISYDWKVTLVNRPLAKWRIHPSSMTWSDSYRFVEEYVLQLEKYKNIFPEFKRSGSREVKILERYIALLKALYHFKAGNRKKARESLTPFAFSSIKLFLLFVLSFFPIKFFRIISKCKNSFELS